MPISRKSGLGVQPPEATQSVQAQAGCVESLNQQIARHDGLVQAVVRQQVPGEPPFEEVLQAGRIGLWRAILGFDPERGFAFSTYAWPCSEHHHLRYADYVLLVGFENGVSPTEGGLRYWLAALGRHAQNGDTVTV